jgi:hypothetical protein
MYLSYFVSNTSNNNLAFWSVNNKTSYLIQNSIENSNIISTYVNWFILFIGIILITIKFRYQIYYDVFLNKINFIIIFFFFLFVCIFILT